MRCAAGICAAWALLFVSLTGKAADLTGKADIVAGDTLVIAGRQIRLHAVDSPAYEATCETGGRIWQCGQEAAFALADAVGRTWVECDLKDAGTLATMVGTCRVGGPKGRDLGAWMVSEGWAQADRQAAPDYGALEDAARVQSLGIWRR